MKNYFLSLAIFIVYMPMYAQQNKSFSVFKFQVDNKIHYSISNALINSEVQLYSENTGGAIVDKSIISKEGVTEMVFDNKKKIAFAINYTVGSIAGNAGNGCVRFFSDNEFTLKNIQADNLNEKNIIHFEASVLQKENTEFQILKSTNGVTYQLFQKIEVTSSNEMQLYSIEDNGYVGKVYYKLQVVNLQEGMRYTSPQILQFGTDKISVYPTQARDNIHINVPNDLLMNHYTIYNATGIAICNGVLTQTDFSIDVTSFAKGMYVISLPKEAQKDGTIFFKN